MVNKIIKASNIAGIKVGDSAAIIGKNGFTTRAGYIPAFVTDASIIDANATSNGCIVFAVEGLKYIFDDNFYTHILDVNNGSLSDLSLKGNNYIDIPIAEKANTESLSGFVAYNSTLTQFSAKIKSFNVNANTITITNESSLDKTLFDIIPEEPFYINLSQILYPKYFSNTTIYVEGKKQEFEHVFPIDGYAGTYMANVKYPIRHKNLSNVYIDGIELERTNFILANSSEITVSLTGLQKELKIKSEYYTTPIIEIGDNISLGSDNTYVVVDSSYSNKSANYNTALTTSNIYKIKIGSNLKSNISSGFITNISQDIVGTVANVDLVSNTFSIKYDESAYPGNFDLANNKVYTVLAPFAYRDIDLGKNLTISNAPYGLNIVRARNVNTSGRRSPWATKLTYVKQIPIQRVQNIVLTESLYKDTTQGVSVKVEISFDAIQNQEVTDYEVSYRLITDGEDLGGYNTVKVPAAGVDSSGKIRYTILNIDRGRTSSINLVVVRITPLNNDIRGVSAERTQYIIGKSAPPQAVTRVGGGQTSSGIYFSWDFPTNIDGTVVDIDLNETLIRKYPGTLTPSEYANNWLFATQIERVATPATSITTTIGSYGTYTYLFKTKDTSKIESDNVAGITLTLIRPSNIDVVQAYSEDDPSANDVADISNYNYTEYYFPSFSNSNSSGLTYSYSSSTDNANGTSSGFSVGITSNDIIASANAFYQTQIRDIGSVVSGSILIESNGYSITKTVYNDFKTIIVSGVSEPSGNTLVFKEEDNNGIGHLLGYSNSNTASITYDSSMKTLVSGGLSGNVFAIWNPGQYTGDVANANSFALIAGVYNTNCIALSNTYYANGNPTGSNVLANLTSVASSYYLVDLQQFIDESGLISAIGQDAVITINTSFRYATTSPYYANGNVNVQAFTDGATNDGWKPHTASAINFRYFQIRTEVINIAPDTTGYTLDRLRYTVDLENRILSNVYFINTIPFTIDYSSMNFLDNPTIHLTMLSDGNYTPVIVDYNTTNANIKVYSNVGLAIANVNVSAQITGV